MTTVNYSRRTAHSETRKPQRQQYEVRTIEQTGIERKTAAYKGEQEPRASEEPPDRQARTAPTTTCAYTLQLL